MRSNNDDLGLFLYSTFWFGLDSEGGNGFFLTKCAIVLGDLHSVFKAVGSYWNILRGRSWTAVWEMRILFLLLNSTNFQNKSL